jgi:hypothetical protein
LTIKQVRVTYHSQKKNISALSPTRTDTYININNKRVKIKIIFTIKSHEQNAAAVPAAVPVLHFEP